MVLMCGHPGGMEVTPAARPDASNPAWPLLHFVNGPEVQFPQLSRIPTARPGFVLTWRIPSWLVKPLEMEEGKPISSWLSCLQPPCGLARSLIQLPVTRLIAAAQTRKGSTYHSHDHDDGPAAPQRHSSTARNMQSSKPQYSHFSSRYVLREDGCVRRREGHDKCPQIRSHNVYR